VPPISSGFLSPRLCGWLWCGARRRAASYPRNSGSLKYLSRLIRLNTLGNLCHQRSVTDTPPTQPKDHGADGAKQRKRDFPKRPRQKRVPRQNKTQYMRNSTNSLFWIKCHHSLTVRFGYRMSKMKVHKIHQYGRVHSSLEQEHC
jgi:hypothetical protein